MYCKTCHHLFGEHYATMYVLLCASEDLWLQMSEYPYPSSSMPGCLMEDRGAPLELLAWLLVAWGF